MLGGKAEGFALAAEQHGDARVGQGIDASREALRRRRRGAPRVTLCTAPKVLMTLSPVKSSCSGAATRSKQTRRHFRVLDVQREGARQALHRERDRHAAPPDGDDEARPGGGERLVGLDEAEQARGGTRSCKGAGRRRMAPWSRTRFRLKGRPTASATAMPCASMPTEPSVTIQVRAPAWRWNFRNDGTLNFFSILLARGRKIAR